MVGTPDVPLDEGEFIVRKGTPDVPLDEGEFIVRKSNRLSHKTAGGPPLPCGFFVEVVEGDSGRLYSGNGDGREIDVNNEMSSLAGSFEARARDKLVEERCEHLETKTHAGYTHDYYRVKLGDLILLEWFRQDENSARAYLKRGFEGLLEHCQELERVLEKHLPKPAEVYDHIPDGNGIRSAFHQVYRVLLEEMFEEGLDLETAHVLSRLENNLTVKPSWAVRKALHSSSANDQVDLYATYQKRTSKLLEPLCEVLPLIKERVQSNSS